MATEREVTFEIVEHVGIMGRDARGWTKELNRVAWNSNPAKYDIRNWDEEHLKMSRGITFSRQEALELKKILNQMDSDDSSVSDETEEAV